MRMLLKDQLMDKLLREEGLDHFPHELILLKTQDLHIFHLFKNNLYRFYTTQLFF